MTTMRKCQLVCAGIMLMLIQAFARAVSCPHQSMQINVAHGCIQCCELIQVLSCAAPWGRVIYVSPAHLEGPNPEDEESFV